MDSVLLTSEAAPGVMLLTLNRPTQRNAIDIALMDAMNAAFDDFSANDQWRAAVLTGAAPAFCAGLDLKTFAAPNAPRAAVTALIRRVPRLGKPIIAAVGGAAYTGGWNWRWAATSSWRARPPASRTPMRRSVRCRAAAWDRACPARWARASRGR